MDEECMIERTKENIKIVRFNRPHKKNAMTCDMYCRLTKILNDAATDDSVAMIVLTGTGDFYSSGNDLVVNSEIPTATLFKAIKELVDAFITFPKILFAIVNGPAIGIAVTTLPLCDFVFASENAYFYTPFTKLGIIAEAASSVTFPKLMGERKAIEMLTMNHKMSAKEALECGLISSVCKKNELNKKAWEKIGEILNLPLDSVLTNKRLIRSVNMDGLIEANLKEAHELARIRDYKIKISYSKL